MLKVGELFAGIGGIGLGLEMTGGFEVKWQVERDEYASKVLAKHWPEVQRFNDVRTFPPGDNNDYYVDLIAGGFPCQDISVAGKGEGLKGERSGLFYEIVRIAERLRPRYLLLENVSALLVRGFGDVLRELAEIGYDAEWHCIPAAAVGAPHRRDRVFIIAHTQHYGSHRHGKDEQKRECEEMGRLEQSRGNGGKGHVADSDSDREVGDQSEHRPRRGAIPRSEEQAAFVADSNSDDRGNGNSSQSSGGKARMESRGGGSRQSIEGADTSVADSTSVRLQGQGESKYSGDPKSFCEGETIESIYGRFQHIWSVEPEVGRVVDGFPGRVDQLRCLGNAVVPQVAQFIGEMILRAEQCKDT
tara:strand:+ start:48 stop:1124 length:1077 start_codon:yes stop_codon:yes gene_type:complete